MKKVEDWVIRERSVHHGALLALANSLKPTKKTGLCLYRALARIEREANRIACQYCNGQIEGSEVELQDRNVRRKVAKVFGGKLPPGFFFNKDPRGYALKLEEKSVPFPLHRDMGGYQILAPEIN